MSSKKFTRVIFFTAFILFFSLYGLFVWAYKMVHKPVRANFDVKNELRLNPPSDLPRSIILGDSKVDCIDPLVLKDLSGKDLYNFSVFGSKVAYQYYLLERLIAADALDHVYLQVGTMHSMQVNRRGYEGATKEQTVRFFLTRDEAKDLDTLFPGAYKDWQDRQMFGPEYFSMNVAKSILTSLRSVFHPKMDNQMLKRTISHHQGRYLKGNTYPVIASESGPIYDYESVQKAFNPKPIKSDVIVADAPIDPQWNMLYDRLVALLEDHQIDYTVFMAPTSNHYAISRENLGYRPSSEVLILNKFDPEKVHTDIPIMPNDLFYDSVHMNANGCAEYAQYFAKEILETPGIEFDHPVATISLSPDPLHFRKNPIYYSEDEQDAIKAHNIEMHKRRREREKDVVYPIDSFQVTP